MTCGRWASYVVKTPRDRHALWKTDSHDDVSSAGPEKSSLGAHLFTLVAGGPLVPSARRCPCISARATISGRR